MTRRLIAATLCAVLGLTLAACTADRETVAGSEVRVGVAEAFTSANPGTGYGRTETNAAVGYLTGTGFGYADAEGAFVEDRGFGSERIVSEDPFTVEYRVADGVTWSDGHPVGAADLLLAWAANSGRLNTPDFAADDHVDPETGRFTDDFPPDTVYFDGAVGAGLELTDGIPELGDDGRTLVIRYSQPVPAWRTVLAPGLPAHVVGTALGGIQPDAAPEEVDAAVVSAIADGDPARLAPLARFWNEGWNFDSTPEDDRLLVAAGPYTITSVSAERIELAANPRYRGPRRPSVEKLSLRVVPDPLEAVSLLGDGELDVVAPAASAEVADALDDLPDAEVLRSSAAVVEHVELRAAGGRSDAFADPGIRRAFLQSVPRDEILRRQIAPIDPDAVPAESFTLRPQDPGYDSAVAQNGSADYADSDPDAARRLLGSATPRICLLYDPGSPRRVAEFGLLRDAAEEAGFIVDDCSSPDWQNLLGVDGAYDVALYAWDTRHLPAAALAAPFVAGSAADLTGFRDDRVDDLARTLPAADARAGADALAEIDARVWDAAIGLPLYAYPTLVGVGERITGVRASAVAPGLFWNAWEWTPQP